MLPYTDMIIGIQLIYLNGLHLNLAFLSKSIEAGNQIRNNFL